ncbi:hypothetical protein MAN_06350, partial [Metarhizium hybridum]
MAPDNGSSDLVKCNQFHVTNSSATPVTSTVGERILLAASNWKSLLFVLAIINHVNGIMMTVAAAAAAKMPYGLLAAWYLMHVTAYNANVPIAKTGIIWCP